MCGISAHIIFFYFTGNCVAFPIKQNITREGILKDVQSRRDHPTANMVYESVRKEQPNISLGTVYRNLNVLVEHGLISKSSTGMGSDHFDGYMEPHHHFICKECNNVIDIHRKKNNDKYIDGNLVVDYEIKYRGICKECLERKN